MAENSNLLPIDRNENIFRSPISSANDSYVTAVSDDLNTTDDLTNHSFQRFENANDEHPSDPNSNVFPVETDLSLTECFGRMQLSSDSNVTFGSELQSASLLPESTDMPAKNPFFVAHDFPLSEPSSPNVLEEAFPSCEEDNSLLKGTCGHDVSKEELTSPEINGVPKQNSVLVTPEKTLPCHEVYSSPLPVDSVEQVCIPSTDTPKQDVCESVLLGDTLPLPESVRKSIENASNLNHSEVLSSPGKNDVEHQIIESKCEGESVSENVGEKEKSVDISGSTLLGQVPSLEDFSISCVSSTNISTLNPNNESALQDVSVSENQDLLKPSNLPSTPAKAMDNCVDLVSAINETKVANSVNPGDNLFKVPALPDENVKPEVMHCSNDQEQDSFGLSMPLSFSSGVPVTSFPMHETDVGSCNKFSECINNQDVTPFGNIPVKLDEQKEGFLGIQDAVVFTDLKNIGSPGYVVDDLFKVPDAPKDEDEEFADAVQFFKDPSAFKYLENIETSAPPDSIIPRSSLYLAFDPLHSKIVHGSQMQGIQLRRSEMGVEAKGERSSLPENKNIVDVSARESMGNILISFDSPKPVNWAQSEKGSEEFALPSEAPKCYTEDELQQALKIHELTLQEMYLKRHRELEQELAKAKEDSQATMGKMTCLCNALRCTVEELLAVGSKLAEDKMKIQEELSDKEKEIEKLKEDLKRGDEDLQSVENTFSDFHKRYEQCKGMLKSYKDNEVHFKEEFTNMTTKLSEKEQEYVALQERTQELLDKANGEILSAKKSSEGQVTVLKAQLKKAELKISGLESDIKKIKIENSQLGGICDDLMDKVSKS